MKQVIVRIDHRAGELNVTAYTRDGLMDSLTRQGWVEEEQESFFCRLDGDGSVEHGACQYVYADLIERTDDD